MDIQQEYFARHGFDKPVCYPDNDGTYNVILKNNNAKQLKQPRYIIANIQLNKQEGSPSFYKFVQSVPYYNAIASSASIMKHVWDKKINYDEWDYFIRTWTESNKDELVVVEEFVIAAMEIFLYSHDSWLAQNLTDRQKNLLVDILDETLSIESRLTKIREVEEFIRAKNKNVYNNLAGLLRYGDEKFHASWIKNFL